MTSHVRASRDILTNKSAVFCHVTTVLQRVRRLCVSGLSLYVIYILFVLDRVADYFTVSLLLFSVVTCFFVDFGEFCLCYQLESFLKVNCCL